MAGVEFLRPWDLMVSDIFSGRFVRGSAGTWRFQKDFFLGSRLIARGFAQWVIMGFFSEILAITFLRSLRGLRRGVLCLGTLQVYVKHVLSINPQDTILQIPNQLIFFTCF